MSPEVLKGEELTLKSDVYSFGIILWELLTREKPYKEYDALQVMELVSTKGLRMEIPNDCDASYKMLIERCWDDNPEKRPSMTEIKLQLKNLIKNCSDCTNMKGI